MPPANVPEFVKILLFEISRECAYPFTSTPGALLAPTRDRPSMRAFGFQ